MRCICIYYYSTYIYIYIYICNYIIYHYTTVCLLYIHIYIYIYIYICVPAPHTDAANYSMWYSHRCPRQIHSHASLGRAIIVHEYRCSIIIKYSVDYIIIIIIIIIIICIIHIYIYIYIYIIPASETALQPRTWRPESLPSQGSFFSGRVLLFFLLLYKGMILSFFFYKFLLCTYIRVLLLRKGVFFTDTGS